MQVSPFLALLSEHLLAFVLIVVSPLVSYFYERPFLRNIANSAQKVGFYRYVLIVQWPVAAAALWISGSGNLFFPPASQGHGLPAYARILFAILLAAFFILGLMPVFQSLRGEKFRAAYAAAYRRSLNDVSKLLPETHEERLWFAAISVTAGVCEEVLCRGFMFRYLDGIALHLSLLPTILLASAVFGVNHIYQGKLGMLKTGIAGLAFGGLFLLTGNLLLPILLHIAIDMQTVVVLRPANTQQG
ncbi:MAG: CPBP family intramembrane glutamic endopeptidase [Terracidiphilus sp.]|jgi:membrane protease YdiL (CAAX protease family)